MIVRHSTSRAWIPQQPTLTIVQPDMAWILWKTAGISTEQSQQLHTPSPVQECNMLLKDCMHTTAHAQEDTTMWCVGYCHSLVDGLVFCKGTGGQEKWKPSHMHVHDTLHTLPLSTAPPSLPHLPTLLPHPSPMGHAPGSTKC